MRDRGIRQPIAKPDAAPPYELSLLDERAIDDMRKTHIVGSADKVAVQLRELAESAKLDEVVVLTWAHDVEVRRRSYELLARAFELVPETSQSAAE